MSINMKGRVSKKSSICFIPLVLHDFHVFPFLASCGQNAPSLRTNWCPGMHQCPCGADELGNETQLVAGSMENE